MEKESTIFSIARDKDLRIEFNKIRKDLATEIRVHAKKYTIEQYLDVCIKYWPYRCGAVSVDDYLADIGIDSNRIYEEKDILIYLELLINLLYWAPEQEANDDTGFSNTFFLGKTDIEKESNRIILNIEYILSTCCNMTIQEEEAEYTQYCIRMKNAQAEVVAATTPELKDVILSYLDIRTENDVSFKKSVIQSLHSYMEPRRAEFRSLSCSTISEEFFASMNQLGIRHNTESQIKLDEQEQIEVYDKLYFLALCVLETVQANEYKEELKAIRVERKEQKV
ncbi:MAG: hypothetical protein J6P79_12630 [Pseudobutyrivibrio sp.]|nr:hypothetical protein [Pseudobutyrivibrio sp.]